MADWDIGSTGLRSYTDYLSTLNSTQTREPRQDLGKNEFLELLSAQLRYQDPLEPQKDSDFIAQLAQFTSLEQITNLNATMTMQYTNSLVGKYVYAEIYVDGVFTPVFGPIDCVVQKDGESYVQVGDNMFKASAIQQVFDKDLFESANPLVDASNLIGRYIEGTISETDEDGITTSTDLAGIVTRVFIEKGVMYAELESGEKLPIGNIHNIKDKAPETIPEEQTEDEGDAVEDVTGNEDGDGEGSGDTDVEIDE